MSYNPFRKLLVDTFVDSKEHKFFKIVHLLPPYLSITELVTLSLLNSTFNKAVNEWIWKEPQFSKFAYIHDTLYMFNRFLQHLPKVQPKTSRQVQKIQLAKLEESLYERVNPRFFEILVHHCTHMTFLDLSQTDFFHLRSLPGGPWSLPHLTYLNVSYCSQVNDDLLIRIARGCRQLVQVRLDGLARHKGQGLACLAAECDALTSISARYNTAMTDEAVVALAKFRHIKLKELDLTGCTKLTDVGFEMLARYCAHLQYISVAQTSCRVLDRFTCFQNHTRSMDISGVKSTTTRLAKWVWNTPFKVLEDITMDMATAIELIQEFKANEQEFKTVKRIMLMNLQERTPLAHFYQMLRLFPNLSYITFVRAYFESDFLLGVYRTPSPESEEYINDFRLHCFNLSHSKIIATVIREREDNLDCSLLNW